MGGSSRIFQSDNLPALERLPSESFDLIYIDPPFNTGKAQRAVGDDGTIRSFEDRIDNLADFLRPRAEHARRLLKDSGSFFLHIDCRESHYCKVMLDSVFGRSNFQNEIIWAYDYGGRSKRKWSAKHDSIFWYTKNNKGFTFNYDAMDRIPYMAPGLVGKEKAARGKTPTDVWWHTIVPTNGCERVGYPTQKPLGVLERIVKIHSREGDWILDFFAGSGTTGEAAGKHRRNFVMIDKNPEAVQVMEKRLARFSPRVVRP